MDPERYYNIVYDQQFSPSGKYLATCDAFGRIAVFRSIMIAYLYCLVV